jgi:hypothetical protein
MCLAMCLSTTMISITGIYALKFPWPFNVKSLFLIIRNLIQNDLDLSI